MHVKDDRVAEAESPRLPEAARDRRATPGVLRWAPWLVGIAILALLFVRVPLDDLLTALRGGPAMLLAFFTAWQVGVGLVADTWATERVLRIAQHPIAWRELLALRGVTNLFGLVNHTVAQAAVVYHLRKRGTSLGEAMGAVGLVIGTSFAALFLLGVVGVSMVPAFSPAWRVGTRVALGASLVILFLLTTYPPRWLRARTMFEPWVAAGGLGSARAIVARLAHFGALIVLNWIALVIWGVDIGLPTAVPLLAAIMLVAALPITPSGAGATQAAQIFLLSSFVARPTPDAREAFVLAFGLVHYAATVAAQALLGLAALRVWRRDLRSMGTAADVSAPGIA